MPAELRLAGGDAKCSLHESASFAVLRRRYWVLAGRRLSCLLFMVSCMCARQGVPVVAVLAMPLVAAGAQVGGPLFLQISAICESKERVFGVVEYSSCPYVLLPGMYSLIDCSTGDASYLGMGGHVCPDVHGLQAALDEFSIAGYIDASR